ncbi:hypothetical protein T492DRAFT_936188 [Pavlovales sp. CCMP2436]|nr:hypothetical protein T492DRAFT_936188 [Pavlovales sp. CCMP2436]
MLASLSRRGARLLHSQSLRGRTVAHTLRRVPAGLPAASLAVSRSLSTVSEITVNCTFIKPDGKRVTVPGMVGWSLLKTAQHHGVPLEGWESAPSWYEDYGDGPATAADHVVVANEWVDKLAPMYQDELDMLGSVDHVTPNSRLAAVIKLTKALEGITVYIPPENMSYKGYNF